MVPRILIALDFCPYTKIARLHLLIAPLHRQISLVIHSIECRLVIVSQLERRLLVQ